MPPLGQGAAGGEGGAGGPEGGDGGDGGCGAAGGGEGGAADLAGAGAGRFSLTRMDFGFSCLWLASVLNTFNVIAANKVVFYEKNCVKNSLKDFSTLVSLLVFKYDGYLHLHISQPSLIVHEGYWPRLGNIVSAKKKANIFFSKLTIYHVAIKIRGCIIAILTSLGIFEAIHSSPCSPFGPIGPWRPGGPASPGGPFGPGLPILPSFPFKFSVSNS